MSATRCGKWTSISTAPSSSPRSSFRRRTRSLSCRHGCVRSWIGRLRTSRSMQTITWPDSAFACGRARRSNSCATPRTRVSHCPTALSQSPRDTTSDIEREPRVTRPFTNRREAGRILAERLRGHTPRSNVVVLALPRGGVPVGYEVAAALDAPLDVFVVRKLGAPGNEEYAIGAIASGGIGIVDARTVAMLGLSRQELDRVVHRERGELDRRERLYRRGRPFPNLDGKTVVLVDDGLATGSTMRVAVEAIRSRGPAAVIAAVPVASREACAVIAAVADMCVCAMTPEPFHGSECGMPTSHRLPTRKSWSCLHRATPVTCPPSPRRPPMVEQYCYDHVNPPP